MSEVSVLELRKVLLGEKTKIRFYSEGIYELAGHM